MKQYTHAWIAMMAMMRLDRATIPNPDEKAAAATLVKWFKDNKDDVITGAWYPDAVIKDMATGHILKHIQDNDAIPVPFRKLPDTYHIYKTGKLGSNFGKPYRITLGNLPDRCEAITHSIIDNLKMFENEKKGSTIIPSEHHIVALFLILSHYIADAHMPLHCDGRKYSDKKNVHGKIEDNWDDRVQECYEIDYENKRFFYDKGGYPLKEAPDPVLDWVEDQITSRRFDSNYGPNNSNTWDFMSAITQYSYLTSHEMVPDSFDVNSQDYKELISMITLPRFEQLSREVIIDSIDSVAKVWLRAWKRFEDWQNARPK